MKFCLVYALDVKVPKDIGYVDINLFEAHVPFAALFLTTTIGRRRQTW
jgi:hypothetical protein